MDSATDGRFVAEISSIKNPAPTACARQPARRPFHRVVRLRRYNQAWRASSRRPETSGRSGNTRPAAWRGPEAALTHDSRSRRTGSLRRSREVSPRRACGRSERTCRQSQSPERTLPARAAVPRPSRQTLVVTKLLDRCIRREGLPGRARSRGCGEARATTTSCHSFAS